MESVSLKEAVSTGRLQEQEAWAVVSQSLEAMQSSLATLNRLTLDLDQVDRWRSAIVTPQALHLTPGGEVKVEHRQEEELTNYLPQKMKPLLDINSDDLERLAVYSLAKTVLASLESVKSPDLLLLLRSALVPSLASVPLLAKVANYTSKTISSQSAQRIVSSLYYKHLGLQGHSMRKSSTARSLPNFSGSTATLLSSKRLPPLPPLSSDTSSSRSLASTSSSSSISSTTSSLLRSLPPTPPKSMPPSPPPYRDQTESELCLRFGIREHVYEDIEDVDTKSVENVCNFINNNDVFSLLELPGLKYNKTKPQPPSLTTPPLPPKRTKEEKPKMINVTLLSGQRVKVTLKSKDTPVSEVLSKALTASKVSISDRSLFCLSVKKAGDHYFLNTTDRAWEVSSSVHLRFLHYPTKEVEKLSPVLRELLYHQVSHDLAEGLLQLGGHGLEGLGLGRLLSQAVSVPHYGSWFYRGTADKREDSEVVTLWVGADGVELAGRPIGWKDIQQISYSHTFIQLLCQEGHRLKKQKICLTQTRHVYDLMMVMKDHFVNRSKAETIKSRQRELFKLDNICDQLVKLTKDVVKTMGTPKRKRSKSADPALCKKSLKKPKLQRSLTFSDTKKKAPALPYRYKLYLEQEDEQYLPTEKINAGSKDSTTPRKTRIRTTTNPLTNVDLNQQAAVPSAPVPVPPRRPRMAMGTRTPTRMGTRIQTVALKRHQDNVSTVPRRIVCLCLNRIEVEDARMRMEKTDSGLEIVDAAGGKLVPGDRLVAVNGRSMEGAGVERATFLLHNSGNLLNFIISRA